ncbi:hypothetical protein [Acetobacter pasteurianus]|uniref:hypothetical protein n=1 Tax=Acetobacter pasteurianus TaxID=438 RepID=UPI00350E562B
MRFRRNRQNAGEIATHVNPHASIRRREDNGFNQRAHNLRGLLTLGLQFRIESFMQAEDLLTINAGHLRVKQGRRGFGTGQKSLEFCPAGFKLQALLSKALPAHLIFQIQIKKLLLFALYLREFCLRCRDVDSALQTLAVHLFGEFLAEQSEKFRVQ